MSDQPSPLGPGLRAAIRDARVPEPDHRGLMPLDAARAWLAGRTVYEQGSGALVEGTYVLESDTTWAALLSLADAAEFTAHARRLRWRTHVRGHGNLSLVERYGDGVLPWLSGRVDEHGVLHDVPWCVLPCLLACGTAEAFDVAARVRAVDRRIDAAPWRPDGGDTDVLCSWVVRHPDPGYRLLAVRADGDATAAAAIGELFRTDPEGTARRLTAAVGEQAATGLLDRLGLAVPPLPAAVRAVLDAAPVCDVAAGEPLALRELDEVFADGLGPMWDNANYYCAAMRMTGYVVPGGGDGLVFQSVVTGLGDYGVHLEFHRFGCGLPAGPLWGAQQELLSEEEAERLVTAAEGEPVRLPNGLVRLAARDAERLGRMDAMMLALTADRAARDCAFLDGDQLREATGLPATARELFTLDAWAHPDMGEQPPSEAEDIVLAAAALRTRRAITRSVTGKSREEHLRERDQILGGWA
ncbi:hypothetical protein [Catellatospora sp. NPDC049609]|uniref:hypothetical protein n=1 Tax=Catellatospora sp. NPDC049609 TaxID=3155505 RepID=UPI0034257511